MDALVAAVVPGANEEALGEGEEMTLWSIAITTKSHIIRSINASF